MPWISSSPQSDGPASSEWEDLKNRSLNSSVCRVIAVRGSQEHLPSTIVLHRLQELTRMTGCPAHALQQRVNKKRNQHQPGSRSVKLVVTAVFKGAAVTAVVAVVAAAAAAAAAAAVVVIVVASRRRNRNCNSNRSLRFHLQSIKDGRPSSFPECLQIYNNAPNTLTMRRKPLIKLM